LVDKGLREGFFLDIILGVVRAVVGGCSLLSLEPSCSCVSRDRRAM
jgi:uncharacterized membrane protein YeaQ/YmgE (transglycosylase-associated protein family)